LFLLLECDEDAQKLCARSVLIRSIHHVWAVGDSISDIVLQLKQLPPSFYEPYFAKENSWAVQVDGFCKTLTMQQKHLCREQFRFLDFQGQVDINNAIVELWLIMDYSQNNACNSINAEGDIICLLWTHYSI
jgi:hypothetical protein